MAIVHLYSVEVKDIPNDNQYLGAGYFQKDNDELVNYNFCNDPNIHFPNVIRKNGVIWEAEYPDGSVAYVNYRIATEFDFDTNSPWVL